MDETKHPYLDFKVAELGAPLGVLVETELLYRI
jgi:hypothetical protein